MKLLRFICPECGGHTFGTYKYYKFMGTRYPDKSRIGYCTGFVKTDFGFSKCEFKWVRNAESDAQYIQ